MKSCRFMTTPIVFSVRNNCRKIEKCPLAAMMISRHIQYGYDNESDGTAKVGVCKEGSGANTV